MALPCLLLVFLCFGEFVRSELKGNSENSFRNYEAEITAILNYLNSTPVKVYNYKQATLVNAHTKADISELTLDVSVDCVNNYPELPCTEKILVCNAFVQNSPDEGSRVLNDVKCVPKPEIIIEETFSVSATRPTEVQINETKSIALSNEAVSSEVGEPFLAVRRDSVPCLGCPFDLNPNAEGVDELVDMALRHVETESTKKYAVIKVLRLQQQVVYGIKLILLVEIAPTVCSKDVNPPLDQCPLDSQVASNVCEIVFLHKPWISRVKHVIKNNCTVSQEYVKTDIKPNDLNNEIINTNAGRNKPGFVDDPNFDHIAENGAADDMTPSRLEDLESQIIVETDDVTNQPHQVPSTAQSISNIENQPLEDKPNIYSTEEAKIELSQFFTQEFSETTPLAAAQQSSLLEEDSLKLNHSNSEENLEETTSMKSNSKDFKEETVRMKRAVPQLEKISPEEKGLVKNLADFAAASLDSIDDDNHKRIILQILGAKKMVGDDGVYYRLIMRMGISHCLEDKPPEPNVNCQEKLFENYTKICKVQVYINDDIASPKIVKSQCQNIKRDKDNNSNRTNYSRFKRDKAVGVQTDRQVFADASELFSFKSVKVGGEYEVPKDNEFVVEYLEGALQHLDSKSEHENKLKVQEILSSTSQIVAGHIYRIKAKMILSDCKKTSTTAREQCHELEGSVPKICTIVVYEQLWVPNSRQTNVTCEGDEKEHFFRNKRSTKGLLGTDDVRNHFVMFNEFIRKHNKTYSNKKEYKYRLKVFSDNMEYIKLLNTYEQGTATYGVTQFADLTRQEFSKSLGLRLDLQNENETPMAHAIIPDVQLPTEFDWRLKGVVTEVKNQQQCGSCWAFSVTGNVEGQYAIKHGKLLEFSEQELVDCDKDDQGCNGGLMDNAYRAIEKLGGLETEQDYPYDAEDEKCHFNKTLARVRLSGAVNISHNETNMAKWLVANGPISIAINANAMQFYMGGISHPFKFLCNPKNLDHGVLIVGYGVRNYPLFKKTLPYWIIKNSWGKSWGEQGYYRVYRGDGTCGLNQTPSSAIVA